MREIVLIVHNIRSSYNVGSILRSADGFGTQVYLSGYTPYPLLKNDKRLPHLAQKTHRQIAKTALGAEKTVQWTRREDIFEIIAKLKKGGFTIAALEQTEDAQALNLYKMPKPTSKN